MFDNIVAMTIILAIYKKNAQLYRPPSAIVLANLAVTTKLIPINLRVADGKLGLHRICKIV